MLEIINFPKLRFKSIQLRNMKPYLFCLLSIFSVQTFGQNRNARTELGMSFGSYAHSTNNICSSEYINSIVSSPIDFTTYTNVNWYGASRQIRNYDFHWNKRIKQSKNLRREFYLGGRVAGQFQHRTLFIGSKEKLQEETVIDQKAGIVKRSYAFETYGFSELNDYVNVSPYGFLRVLINDYFSINASMSTSVLIPVRTGVQIGKYTGQVTREYEKDEVQSEYRKYDGDLTFTWHRAPFKPRFRIETSVAAELKPFDKKPYYLSFGYLIGQQITITQQDDFRYSGYRIGIQSQF